MHKVKLRKLLDENTEVYLNNLEVREDFLEPKHMMKEKKMYSSKLDFPSKYTFF